jgi:hypothetical protein
MKTGLFAAILIFSGVIAKAQDLKFDEYRRFLMSGNQTNKKMAIQTTCTTAAGQTYRVGEKGYDTCLADVKKSNDQKQTSTSTSTTTIHIGN